MKTETFGSSQGQHPLNVYQDVDFTLSGSDSYDVRTNNFEYDGYIYLLLRATANNGSAPVLNIKSIEIINQ